MSDRFFYGGQAVIEGVMMRGRNALAIAVRRPDSTVVVHEEELRPWARRFPILRRPIVRGVVALIEAMVIGVRALTFSANQAVEGEGEELGTRELVVTVAVSFALAIGLFKILPAFIIRLIEGFVASDVLLNAVEGGIKILFFILYILAISLAQDIKRVFQYHGAEHKAINCHEAGDPLTVANVARHSIVHTRCGTNFVLIVLFMSVFLFSVATALWGRPAFVVRVLLHLALLPVVAGISYEIIRHAAQERSLAIVRLIATPGLWLQRLTTRPPDESQIAVAIRALEVVLARDEVRSAPAEAAAGNGAAPHVAMEVGERAG